MQPYERYLLAIIAELEPDPEPDLTRAGWIPNRILPQLETGSGTGFYHNRKPDPDPESEEHPKANQN